MAVTELDNRIAIVRANLRELVEQAASSAGAANEELLSQRIAEQEERLARLRQEREQLPEEETIQSSMAQVLRCGDGRRSRRGSPGRRLGQRGRSVLSCRCRREGRLTTARLFAAAWNVSASR